jgi:hypothetical protein
MSTSILKSPFDKCLFCLNDLFEKSQPTILKCYFYAQKPEWIQFYPKKCEKCKSTHYLSYAENSSSMRKFSDKFITDKFVNFTSKTIYERLILDSFTSDLLFKHSTFKAYANSYNYLLTNSENGEKRAELYEKNLTMSWYYYKYLEFELEYNKTLKNMMFPKMGDLRTALKQARPKFLKHFASKWQGPNHLACTDEPTNQDYKDDKVEKEKETDDESDNLTEAQQQNVQPKNSEEKKTQPCSLTYTIDGIFKVNRLKCVYQNVSFTIPEIGTYKIS